MADRTAHRVFHANWMKQQPGYISTQLHRAVGESYVFMNYAVWESVAHFKAAFSHPDFRAALAAYPSSVVASPHLFESHPPIAQSSEH